MRTPLDRAEVQRLQAHMRKHGARSLTMRQHNAIWDFLFDLPESHAWMDDMAAQIHSGQQALRPTNTSKK